CETEIFACSAGPGFHHGRAGRCVEGAVDLDAIQLLRVEAKEVFALQILGIEFSLPTGIAESGHSNKEFHTNPSSSNRLGLNRVERFLRSSLNGEIMSSSPVAVGSVGLPLGSAAIDFQLKGVDGKTHSLKSFADKKALAIVFSCNHCPYVQAYEARMVQLQRDYLPKGASLIAINSNDDTG